MSEKITAADAIRLLDAHEAAAVDVREPDEFAVGHIPGAKPVSYTHLDVYKRQLLGDNIFERAKKYRKRIQQSTCTVNADGVRHISAMVQGSGGSYYLSLIHI